MSEEVLDPLDDDVVLTPQLLHFLALRSGVEEKLEVSQPAIVEINEDELWESVEATMEAQSDAKKERTAEEKSVVLLMRLGNRLEAFAESQSVNRRVYQLFSVLKEHRPEFLIQIADCCLTENNPLLQIEFIEALHFGEALRQIMFNNRTLADSFREVYEQTHSGSGGKNISDFELSKYFTDKQVLTMFLGHIKELKK